MITKAAKYSRWGRAVGAALLLAPAALSLHAADALEQSLQLSEDNNRKEQRTQQRIDSLSEQTRAMLEEYQLLNREYDALKVYNDQLERIAHTGYTRTYEMTLSLDDLPSLKITANRWSAQPAG